MHVVVRSEVRSLRSQFLFPTVRAVIAKTNRSRDVRFRICHFSVQGDHLHLLVEADDERALRRGMHGFAARLAWDVNRLLMRSGRVIADRWYGRSLESARAVRRALVYVLANDRKHAGRSADGGCTDARAPAGVTRSAAVNVRAAIDVFSSGPYFDGYREFAGRAPISECENLIPRVLLAGAGHREASPIRAAQTPLLASVWKRMGLLSVFECPSSSVVARSAAGST